MFWVRRALVALLATLVLATAAPIAQAAGPFERLTIEVPYRSQFDDSPYAGANCGPASLGMILGAFDKTVPTAELRAIVNQLQGSWDYDNGTFVDNLGKIAVRYGLQSLDLYAGKRYQKWTLDLVRSHLESGHPVVPQVKYPYLPGTAGTSYWGDHYIVLFGTIGDDFLYHDPASRNASGQARRISAGQLLKAWRTSDAPMAGVAFAPAPGGPAARVRSSASRPTGFIADATDADVRIRSDASAGGNPNAEAIFPFGL